MKLQSQLQFMYQINYLKTILKTVSHYAKFKSGQIMKKVLMNFCKVKAFSRIYQAPYEETSYKRHVSSVIGAPFIFSLHQNRRHFAEIFKSNLLYLLLLTYNLRTG